MYIFEGKCIIFETNQILMKFETFIPYFVDFKTFVAITWIGISMFCLHELHILLAGLFNWGCPKMHLFLESWNCNSFVLVGYQNGQCAADPSLAYTHELALI